MDGKEDLLQQLTDQAQADAETAIEALEENPTRPRLLGRSFGLAVDQTLSDLGRVSLVLRQRPGTPTGDAVIERRRAYDRRLSELITEGQKSGDIRDDIHPMLLSRLTLGMVSWLVEWFDPALSRFDPDVVRDAVIKIVTDGVVTD